MSVEKVKEKISAFLEKDGYSPLGSEDLIIDLGLKGASLREFWPAMEELEKEGAVVKNRHGEYGVPEKLGLVVGKIQLNSKGFGFVLAPPKSEKKDVYISSYDLGGAMHNDVVMAKLNKNSSPTRPEGKIIRIIERANKKVVGIFKPGKKSAFVLPDDRRIGTDIYIAEKDYKGALPNQKVVAEITTWPENGRKPEGRIIEILGSLGDIGLEIISIIKQNDLPLEFPDNVLAAADKVPTTIKKKEISERQDRRNRKIITIDGEDAKDLDDAVYVEKQGKDYLLGVYIADVSYYVKEGSVLDKEAYERGTSVYLVDRVLPMLPVALSNGICSLNEGVDRLAMGCEMVIDGESGKVKTYQIFPTVINSCHRMTYTAVRKMLVEKDEEMLTKYADILPMVEDMEELCYILKKKRKDRGALDFDLPEQKVILDEEKKPIAIVPRERSIAEFIIEEFMLAANETVAEHMVKAQWPFIYRVHDLPDEGKMSTLANLLANFGIVLRVEEDMEPVVLQKALSEIAGRPEEKLISTVTLRSLKQAVYQTENVGHFGLAAEFYTHFTSPIRRYPDLIVHRLLRKWMESPVLKKTEAEELIFKLDMIASHASTKERAAAEAERATVDLKEAEYMAGHIGEEYIGTISGVTGFGMFVELDNGCEGLVHITSLTDDYYDYDEGQYALVGQHLHKTYRLGDKVKVEVLGVNIPEHQIDLVLAGESSERKAYIKSQLELKAQAGLTKGKGSSAFFSTQKSKGREEKKEVRRGKTRSKKSGATPKKAGKGKTAKKSRKSTSSAGKNMKDKGRRKRERTRD